MLGLKNRGNLDIVVQDEFEHLATGFRQIFLVQHNEDGTHRAASPIAYVPIGGVVIWTTETAPEGWLLCRGQAVDRATYHSLFQVIGTTYGGGDGNTTFNVPDLQQRFPLGKAAAGTGSTLAGTGGAIDHVHTGPAHTHTAPAHTHSTPNHTHPFSTTSDAGGDHSHAGSSIGSESAHTHTYAGTTSDPGAGVRAVQTGSASAADENHTHTYSGTTDAGSSHTHSLSLAASGTHTHGVSGTTGSDGASTTGSGGNSATSSAGTGDTGSNNPPYVVLNYIIRT